MICLTAVLVVLSQTDSGSLSYYSLGPEKDLTKLLTETLDKFLPQNHVQWTIIDKIPVQNVQFSRDAPSPFV